MEQPAGSESQEARLRDRSRLICIHMYDMVVMGLSSCTMVSITTEVTGFP
jgi:hypothetical protein